MSTLPSKSIWLKSHHYCPEGKRVSATVNRSRDAILLQDNASDQPTALDIIIGKSDYREVFQREFGITKDCRIFLFSRHRAASFPKDSQYEEYFPDSDSLVTRKDDEVIPLFQ